MKTKSLLIVLACVLASHTHSGADIISGTVAEPRIDPAIARDSEIVPIVLSNDGAGSGLDADLLDGLNSTAFWKLGGNGGTSPGVDFLGTTDNQPFEVRVNNARVLRLEPGTDSPNIIGGFSANLVQSGVVGATIAGGGSSGFTNLVAADYSTIRGGRQNAILTNASRSTIAGGAGNAILADSHYSTIGGGRFNTIQTNAIRATVAGGEGNTIQANSLQVSIGGGEGNMVLTNSGAATISGGFQNRAKGGELRGGWRPRERGDRVLRVGWRRLCECRQRSRLSHRRRHLQPGERLFCDRERRLQQRRQR